MVYKNTSYITKKFYGVEFKPGDVKEVTGYINDPKMIKMSYIPKSEPPRKIVKSEPVKQTSTKSPERTDSNKETIAKEGSD